jgi:hypothetical protein
MEVEVESKDLFKKFKVIYNIIIILKIKIKLKINV